MPFVYRIPCVNIRSIPTLLPNSFFATGDGRSGDGLYCTHINTNLVHVAADIKKLSDHFDFGQFTPIL